MRKLNCSILFLSLLFNFSFAQKDIYVGTFNNAQYTISLQMKSVPGGYHGVVQSAEGRFAVSAQKKGQQLVGVIYTEAGNIDFRVVPQQGRLAVSALGKTEWYHQSSTSHQLAGVDLSPYMTSSSNSPDYSQRYSQHNGKATETRRTYQPQQGNNPNASGDTQLFQLIAGSQLAVYSSTSIFNDANASSLTYVNFCSNGRFSINYDGSFSVRGNYGGNAQGASNGKSSGNWTLLSSSNGPQLQLQYGNGQIENYPVYKNYLLQGSWRVGNTKYAIQRNKAVCY